MHPRVFAALGADLVTNDIVAVIELVKNAYDAFARNVQIRFRQSSDNDTYLEISDDGHGMTRDVIENVWCLVATPHKQQNPTIKKGGKARRVTGEKGLGRLSVARLGNRLSMLTQAIGEPCWDVTVDWASLSEGDELANCFVLCQHYTGTSPFGSKSGTRLRIYGLREKWDFGRVSDLEQNLARLISPFASVPDFRIFLSGVSDTPDEVVEITAPEFLSTPKYSIQGEVDSAGNISGLYRFNPIGKGEQREKGLDISWGQVLDGISDHSTFEFPVEQADCGPFSFEIRAWDIAREDTAQLAEHFSIQKSDVRKAIRAHKGISVYRDNVLVLPKSDNARDWLGLDLRRISRVGKRLSTNQLVGYVSISADHNSKIEDTSDRERLASSVEVAEFEEILKAVIFLLESERNADRAHDLPEQPMSDLFEDISAADIMEEISALAEDGASALEAMQRIKEFSRKLDTTRQSLERRFDHYSRMATVGTIAHMLVHEIRTRTTAFGGFIDFVKEAFGNSGDSVLEEEIRIAEQATDALESLADTFSPLASRNFRRAKRHSILEDRIQECLTLLKGEIRHRQVQCNVPTSHTPVAVDPGELDTIILNLANNALYWMGDVNGKRTLSFKTTTGDDRKRLTVHVTDTGRGIEEKELRRVFLPGVTNKPGGIGMGLAVVEQLVRAYGGSISADSQRGRGAVL